MTELMIDAYSRVCEVGGSEWRNALRERAIARHSEIPVSQRHMIFFDHHGALEVIANSIEVSQ